MQQNPAVPPSQPISPTSPRKRRFKPNVPSGLPAFSYRNSGSDIKCIYCRALAQADAFASIGDFKGPLGFDIEWRPAFKPGQSNRVAVVQLASANMILVIQVSMMPSFPHKVRELLEDPNIPKLGVGIYDDAFKMWQDFDIRMAGAIELSHLARAVDTTFEGSPKALVSLAKLVEKYQQLELVKKKSIVMSNWEQYLTMAQQQYAANDAYAGYSIYQHLLSSFPAISSVLRSEYTIDFDPELEAVRQAERQQRKEEKRIKQLEEKAKKEAKAAKEGGKAAAEANEDDESASSASDADSATEREEPAPPPPAIRQKVPAKGRGYSTPATQGVQHDGPSRQGGQHAAGRQGGPNRRFEEERTRRARIPCPYPPGTCRFGPLRCHFSHAHELSAVGSSRSSIAPSSPI